MLGGIKIFCQIPDNPANEIPDPDNRPDVHDFYRKIKLAQFNFLNERLMWERKKIELMEMASTIT